MQQINEAIAVYGSRDAIPEDVHVLMMLNESLIYTENADGSVDARVKVDCLTSGTKCELAVTDLAKLLDNPDAKQVLYNYIESDIRLLSQGCCHVKSRIRQVVVPMVSQATFAADFHASKASSRW
ncbi:hypothetical protein [Roseobacter sp. GAI101]|uniref:hypothetical protein n=1 Tax=Roseobacter sp. (strain GAI101) TaxID=391589 RepID=UPI0012ED71E3|nr:hypothetical protein [Roseobacter sp. GAI101]